jgi:hypothetical protein
MQIVESPVWPPSKCAVTGRGEDLNGFLDTGSQLTCIDPHIYISYEGMKLLAKEWGFVDPDTHEKLLKAYAVLHEDIAKVKNDLAEANREIDAVHVLRSKGYTSARKPGRPPKIAA